MSSPGNVGVFWDYENCPPSANTSGYDVVQTIRSVAQRFGTVRLLKAYLELPTDNPRSINLRSELQTSGVSLTDCPHNGRKNVADNMIIVDMMTFMCDNPSPATIILISGDRDFAYALAVLRLRAYNVVLCCPSIPRAHASLKSQASECIDWIGGCGINPTTHTRGSSESSANVQDLVPSASASASVPLRTPPPSPTKHPPPVSIQSTKSSSPQPPPSLLATATIPNSSSDHDRNPPPSIDAIGTEPTASDKPASQNNSLNIFSNGETSQKIGHPPLASSSSLPDNLNVVTERNATPIQLAALAPDSITLWQKQTLQQQPETPVECKLYHSHGTAIATNSSSNTLQSSTANPTPATVEAVMPIPMLSTRVHPSQQEPCISGTGSTPIRPASVNAGIERNPLLPLPSHCDQPGKQLVSPSPRNSSFSSSTSNLSNLSSFSDAVSTSSSSSSSSAISSSSVTSVYASCMATPVGPSLPMLPPTARTAAAITVATPSSCSISTNPPTLPTTSLPHKLIPPAFQPLVEELRTKHSQGIDKPTRSSIADALMARDRKLYSKAGAGVTTFREYAMMAERSGIVVLGGKPALNWIALKGEHVGRITVDGRNGTGIAAVSGTGNKGVPPRVVANPVGSSLHSSPIPPTCVFEELIRVLEVLQPLSSPTTPAPLRTQVGLALAKFKNLYKDAGVSSFGAYASMAATKGIVNLNGRDGGATISLRPAWRGVLREPEGGARR